jgi:CHAT domain-containing protein
VYSVALDDRTEMIVQSPTGKLTHHAIALDRRSLQQKVDAFRQLLEKRSTDEYLGLSQRLYNDLIRPLEADLAQAKTLVFIQDGVLRQVPMAALHDGQQFLIQKYAIATTPSLSLTAGTAAQPPYSKGANFGTDGGAAALCSIAQRAWRSGCCQNNSGGNGVGRSCLSL